MDSPKTLSSGSVLLIHRQLEDVDLLAVRIDKEGKALLPLIMFHYTNWEDEDFRAITTAEVARMPKEVVVAFQDDEQGQSALEKCFGPNGYCVGDNIQACIILPIGSKLKTKDTKGKVPHLLKLLDLKTLFEKVQIENKRWCSCQESDSIDNMILCDSTKCEYGWYHLKCKGLPEDRVLEQDYREWFCEDCKKNPEKARAKTTYDNGKFDDQTYDASDERIQLVRAVSKVWGCHKWPIQKSVRKSMESTKWNITIAFSRLKRDIYNKELQSDMLERPESGETLEACW